jgi:hypothetical protein
MQYIQDFRVHASGGFERLIPVRDPLAFTLDANKELTRE